MIVDTQQMTGVLGISKQRLHELARAGKIPRGPRRNTWNLEEVQRAVADNLDPRQASPARGEAPAGTVGRRFNDPPRSDAGLAELPDMLGPRLVQPPRPGTMAHALLMHTQAKAAQAALKAQQLEGKLVSAREVEQTWSSMMSAIRNRMLLVPDKIAARVAAESSILECRALVMDAIVESLSAASEYDPNT